MMTLKSSLKYTVICVAILSGVSLAAFPPGMTKQQLAAAVQGHVLAKGQ